MNLHFTPSSTTSQVNSNEVLQGNGRTLRLNDGIQLNSLSDQRIIIDALVAKVNELVAQLNEASGD